MRRHGNAVLGNERILAEVIKHHVTQVKLSLENSITAHLRTPHALPRG